MSQALTLPPPGFDTLSVDEQIDYVQSLWDRIGARPEDIPVPDWHRKILAERLSQESGEVRDWKEFEENLKSDLSRLKKHDASYLRPPGGTD